VLILVYSQDREENIVNILVRSPVSRKGVEVLSDDNQQRTANKKRQRKIPVSSSYNTVKMFEEKTEFCL